MEKSAGIESRLLQINRADSSTRQDLLSLAGFDVKENTLISIGASVCAARLDGVQHTEIKKIINNNLFMFYADVLLGNSFNSSINLKSVLLFKTK